MYSCGSASETLQWINAIIEFIKPYLNSIINAHVVNFFNDKLWESIDQQWIHCLRHEPLQNLLLLPSGVFQDHWPPSLKEFVMSMRSLMFSREQVDLAKVLPGLNITSLNTVLSQGMNMKKKHEVEVLSAVVSSIANSVSAQTIVDVGAGQGYLAQVLSFQYNHSVVAIDASSHHGKVTDARAERIKKHYAAQMRKSGSGNSVPNVPKTITCRIMSNDMLKALTNMSVNVDEVEQPKLTKQDSDDKTSFVLAGLHACGDLSVTMLKTFLECKEVKAVVSIGCCYNLLSEECLDAADSHCGFPMSSGVKSAGISLGKNSRDLACQSADRWRSLDKDVGLQNFELHAFRAVFQMVLCRYYPDIIKESPSIGRQGKATRRQHQRRVLHSALPSELGLDASLCKGIMRCKENASVDKYLLFEKFSFAGLSRLGLKPLPDIDFHEIWKEAEPFAEKKGRKDWRETYLSLFGWTDKLERKDRSSFILMQDRSKYESLQFGRIRMTNANSILPLPTSFLPVPAPSCPSYLPNIAIVEGKKERTLIL
ncbi:protein with unknown function [Ricinus communis]|uniref:Methyltransferase domain-containing protein n=1 Tax=Ricinus communis TaxID=3988 RepID=B9SVD6_RICCO|nr:protein with unknown function [Ricinus communis]